MRLYEFTDEAVIPTKMVALVNQLQSDLDSGEIDPDNYTVSELQDYLQKYDIVLDDADLMNMITTAPLNTVISNIEGDKVVFKSDDSIDLNTAKEKNRSKDTVKGMAKNALKR